jgi:cysteine synthase
VYGRAVATATGERAAMLDAIGGTPLVRLTRLADASAGEIWVKLEANNPTGSYKDRMALAMIEGAERAGRLSRGQTVVEYTGGSTGSSLAFVCAVKGYPLRIVTSDAFAVEKIRTMEAFGADVELLSSPEGITPQLIPRMMERAAEIVEEVDGYATDQFRNTDMIEGYRGLGREILEQLDGPPDAFCAYIGTAGCFLGVTREIKASVPTLHRIEGGGIGFWPPMLAQEDVDEVIAVPEAEAFAMARRAAQEEGLMSGPSTGANIAAALAVARRLGPGRRVVTTQVDSGLKYLAGALYAGPEPY